MTFFLGTHRPHWLALTGVPLFVSRRTLVSRMTGHLRRELPVARGPWALDSGGFTELDTRGSWSITPTTYAAEVLRLVAEVGRLAWAAPMDWMCEPFILAKTGLPVRAHQERTVDNFVRLRDALGPLVIPVLQGWRLEDYLRCVDLYRLAGVDLDREPLVGVGSVCRRQDTAAAGRIFEALAGLGLRLHGFGIKIAGLEAYGDCLASADSMAWSSQARWDANHGVPSCSPARRRSCANCLHFALEWRDRVVNRQPLRLWETVCAA